MDTMSTIIYLPNLVTLVVAVVKHSCNNTKFYHYHPSQKGPKENSLETNIYTPVYTLIESGLTGHLLYSKKFLAVENYMNYPT